MSSLGSWRDYATALASVLWCLGGAAGGLLDTQASGDGYRRNDTYVGPFELTGSQTAKLDVLKFLGNQNVTSPGGQDNTAPTAAANAILPVVAASASLDRSNANNTGGGAATIANRAGTATGALTTANGGPTIAAAGNIGGAVANAAGSTTVASSSRVNAGTSTNLVGTATPGSGPTGTNVAGVVSANTPGAGNVGAPGLTGTSVTLSAAGDTPLPGSILAASLRQGQSNSIGNAQSSFATAAAARPVIQAPAPLNYGPLGQVRPVGTKDAGYSTATLNGRLGLGRSQLFRTPGSPNAGYLIETDPAFTNQQQWLGSDYFLAQLNLDPERTLKRYGDGFAEQRLVDDQIMALTGKRYLWGYGSTQEAYQALMDSGALYAKEFQLTPGIALSEQQMASLTSDIVWLESQTVSIPCPFGSVADSCTTEALVPRVYLRKPQAGDLQATGSLVSGADITLRNKTGTLTNSGTLYANGNPNQGQGQLTLSANNLNNSGSLVGHQIDLTAKNDINNVGGSIQGIGQDSTGKATSTLTARAGGNILLQTTTIDSSGLNSSRTQADRIATLQAGHIQLDAGKNIVLAGAQFNTDGKLVLKAGQDIKTVAVIETSSLNVAGRGNQTGGYFNRSTSSNVQTNLGGKDVTAIAGRAITLTGANIAAINDVTLVAKDITVSAAVDSASADQKGMTQGGYNRSAASGQSLSSGNIVAGNNVTLVAQNTITVHAATLNADQGQASLIAGGDIKVAGITTTRSTTSDSASSSSGFLSSKSSSSSSASAVGQFNGSDISGSTVLIQSGQVGADGKLVKGTGDVSVVGSSVVADKDLSIQAAGQLSIVAGQSTSQSSSVREDKSSGLMGAGMGIFIGNRSQDANSNDTATRATGSTVGSIGGNVNLNAGTAYTQTGSAVLTPAGNVAIAAQTVNITEARETANSANQTHFSQSGLTVSVSNPMLSAVQTVEQLATASGNAGSTRMTALAAATSVMTVNNAATAVRNGQGDANGQVKGPDGKMVDANTADRMGGITVSVSLGQQSSNTSSVSASNSAVGSTVAAAGNVSITASGAGHDSNINVRGSSISAGNLAVLSAGNQVNVVAAQNILDNRSNSSGQAASIGVSVGLGAGGAGVSLNLAASQSKGNGAGQDITQVDSTVAAHNVLITSGGDTNIKGAVVTGNTVTALVGGDLNITSLQNTSTFKETSASSGVSLSVPLTPGGSLSASVSVGSANINSNFASVGQQSGIRTGDGGFNVNVAGNTNLVGGAITSTNTAVVNGANTFTTGGTLTSRDITNRADFDAQATSLSVGIGSKAVDGKPAVAVGGAAGFGSASGNASTVTSSAISATAGNASARTGDAETGLAPIFNPAVVRGSIDGQVAITSSFGPQASSAWGDYANRRQTQASTPEEAACWAASGACRVAGHTVIGGLTGGTNGAVGAATGTLSVSTIAQTVKDSGLSGPAADLLTAVLTTGVGAAVGGPAGGVTAFNEVTNNYLTSKEWKAYADARNQCNGERICLADADKKYAGISASNDIALAFCATPAVCDTLKKEVTKGSDTYLTLVQGGQLPDYVGIANLQTGGTRLANDPAYRATVSTAFTAAAKCNENPGSCTQTAMAATALVLAPVIGVTAGGAAVSFLVATGRMTVTEAALFFQLGGPVGYCNMKPDSCLLIAETVTSMASGSMAPSAIPVNPGRTTSMAQAVGGVPAQATPGGFVNAAKVCTNGCVINGLTPYEQSLVTQVQNGLDTKGVITEQVLVSVSQRTGMTVLSGGKYGANNGFDLVLQDANGVVTIVMDGKQMTQSGAIGLSPNGAGGTTQLSDAWVSNVLLRLDPGSPAYRAVFAADQSNSLVTAVGGVNRTTGQLVVVPVRVPKKP